MDRAFMPAAMSVLMALGTPACSLSSIAVMPTRSRSRSISSATWRNSMLHQLNSLQTACVRNEVFHMHSGSPLPW